MILAAAASWIQGFHVSLEVASRSLHAARVLLHVAAVDKRTRTQKQVPAVRELTAAITVVPVSGNRGRRECRF
jgi:hypothetical protein